MKLLMLVGFILTILETTMSFKIAMDYPILESAESDVMLPDSDINERFLRQSNQTVEEAIEELRNEILHLKGIDGILNATIDTNQENIKKNSEDIVDNLRDIINNSDDITHIRIEQSHMVDTVSDHEIQILDIQENVIANQENINIDKGNIQANRDNIETNKQSIDTNKKDIIENMQEIQLVDSKYQELADSFEKSNIKFHVETNLTDAHWPDNTNVTYAKELVDTHNALNMSSGTFTAPFDGIFGFFFHAYFCYPDGNLFAYHNDIPMIVHRKSNPSYFEASTVYFARDLKQGDTVKINSGIIDIYLRYFPAKFMGFLLE